jgi:hypothetical protein
VRAALLRGKRDSQSIRRMRTADGQWRRKRFNPDEIALMS